MREREDLVLRLEVDPVHQVEHIPEQVAAQHAVVGLFEQLGDLQPLIASREVAQGRQQVVIDKLDQVLASGALVGIRGPVTPAVGCRDDWLIGLVRHDGILLAPALQVIVAFQEQHPGELRQAVQVAVQPGVLAHDVPRGFDQGGELGTRAGGGHEESNSYSKFIFEHKSKRVER